MAKRKGDYGTGIPRQDVEILARTLWPTIREYLESEEGKREFATWQQEQILKKKHTKSA